MAILKNWEVLDLGSALLTCNLTLENCEYYKIEFELSEISSGILIFVTKSNVERLMAILLKLIWKQEKALIKTKLAKSFIEQ